MDKIEHTLINTAKTAEEESKEFQKQVGSTNLAEDGADIAEETLIVSKQLLDKNYTAYKILAE